jgi:hypothetical protein
MFEHADRHDALERTGDVAVSFRRKRADPVRFFSRARAFDTGNCSVRQRDAGDVRACDLGEIESKPAPA